MMMGYYGPPGPVPVDPETDDKNGILSQHTVARPRDSVTLTTAQALFCCAYGACQCGAQIQAADAVHVTTIDTPLTENSATGLLVFHLQCWEDYQSTRAPRFAANRVNLPEEVIKQEQSAGRDTVDYVNRGSPSAIAIALAYQTICPRIEINWAAPDSPGLSAWVISIPSEATPVVPIDAVAFSDTTFSGLFRYRAVFVVGSSPNLSIARLDKALKSAATQTMEQNLSDHLRASFRVTEKERMDIVSDSCRLSMFRHPHSNPDDSSRTFVRLVVEVAIPREKLEPTMEMFSKSFLNPDGDVQRENDKLVWADVFKEPSAILPAPKETRVMSGDVVPMGKNGARQRQNRVSWATKLKERRTFLVDVMDALEQRIKDEIRKGGTISRLSGAASFCNRWSTDVTEVEQSAETPRWEYLVNAQAVSTFAGIKSADDIVYIVSDDMGELHCYRSDSAQAKVATMEFIPCVWAGEAAVLQKEMDARVYIPVFEKEVTLLYRSPPTTTTKKG